LRAFLLDIVNVFAIFPARHALVVMASFILVAYPMRIADEDRLHAFLRTEVHHLPRRFVAQVAHLTFDLAPDAFQRISQPPIAP
jgi:hypothetical protein